MKNVILAFVIAGGLAVAGCATSGPGPAPVPAGPVAQDATITSIQNAVANGCGYLVAVETVAAIVATFTGGQPIVGLVSNVAHAICNAVLNKTARLDGVGPSVNGVPIQGHFIR